MSARFDRPRGAAPQPDRIVLVGARAAGKTSLGRALARRLRRPFRDTDLEVRARTGRSSADWLRQSGEARFRRVEARITRALLARRGPLVLALGGGAVLDAGVRAALRRCPCVVWLRASIAELARRLRRSARTRPSLTGRPPHREVAAVLRVRRPLYRAIATHALNTTRGNVEDWLEVLLARLGPHS